MPDSVENEVFMALKGLTLTDKGSETCDFSLEEQNAALETQGVLPRVNPNRRIKLGDTVTYIVAAVIVNENDEVLMIQEAKESCAGKWYLPAGRMEKGEDIIKGTKREVLEETGLHIKCTSLLMVECGKGSWFRFVMTGIVEGGTLKTPAQADQESIQAKWVKDMHELSLRAKDVLPLIERGRDYAKAKLSHDAAWHFNILPNSHSHERILLRLVVAIKKKANSKVHVLLSERNSWHLPTCEIHPSRSLHSTLKRFMVEIFGADVAPHRPHGILSVELDTLNGDDGMCLTLLVAFKAPLEDVPIIAKLEETNLNVPKISELNAAVIYPYLLADYKALEILILQFYHWNVMFPTAAHYTHCFLQAALRLEDFRRHGTQVRQFQTFQRPRVIIREMHGVIKFYLDKMVKYET